MVAILDSNGIPLNPINDYGKIRILLKNNQAKIYKREPILTIQLNDVLIDNQFKNIIEPLTLGIDCGYSNVGFSVISSNKEIVGGELKLRNDISELITAKKMYRTQRRHKLRYRKARFDNRRIDKGWLAPSVKNKLDSHLKLIDDLCKILPIQKIVIESAAFDIQKLNNPDIGGEQYQQGERYDHIGNVRQYVIERDGHQCQNPNCKNQQKNPILNTHHIIFKEFGGTDRPNNFLTLCVECHKPENHKKGGFLYKMCMEAMKGNLPKFKQFKGETFMSIINQQIIDEVKKRYPTKIVLKTFGYVTKSKRIGDQQRSDKNEVLLKVNKTHRVDGFYIAGGSVHTHTPSSEQTNISINRRNNRSLQGFRDSKWIDVRTGEIVSGAVLNCGRITRNKNNSTENLKKYRYPILKKDKNGVYVRSKITTGNVSIREKRHAIQKGDLIEILNDWSNKDNTFSVNKNQKFISGGVQNEGAYVIYPSLDKTIKRYVPSKICKVIRPNKGFEYKNENKTIELTKIITL